MTIKPFFIVVCVLGLPDFALAQTVAPPAAKTDCAPTQAKPNNPNGLNTTGSDRPLTEKLAQSGGVLCPPPEVDSKISVSAPSTGSNMPVVPPPGSPGAGPSVQPKQ